MTAFPESFPEIPSAYLAETPFGVAGIRVRATGGMMIEPAFGLDAAGNPDTGFHGSARGVAAFTINGTTRRGYFDLIPNPRQGQYNRQYPEHGETDPREWVADFGMYSEYTAAMRDKLAAWFTAHREEIATPERIAGARLRDAIRQEENAKRDLSEASTAQGLAAIAEREARAELRAALANLTAGNTAGWVQP